MKVLVTGGAGYIGSHTCKALAAAGHTPVVYDDLSNGHRSFVRWGPFEQGDIRDRDRLLRTMTEHRVSAVVHFAALAEVAESVRRPAAYWDVNVAGTLSLLQAMAAADVHSLVFSSTCATYGDPAYLPLDERHPQRPVSPYGETKLAMERMIADMSRSSSLRHVALRYFNACGADPAGEIGEAHKTETHVIPRAILAAMGLADFAILGTDYPTPDGTAIRDYVHVCDLAEAHVAALEYLGRGGASESIDLGTGKGLSVREVVSAVARQAGRPLHFEERPRREGDPSVLVAAGHRARDILGFDPARSDIETIVADAWAWHETQERARVVAA